jgi:uncharacterized protein with PIN domain
MKLVFDQMLKNLATWCRILGLDSEFYSGSGDTELLELAKSKERILVTRDVQLSERCKKHDVRCIFVKSDVLEEQIAQIINESGAEVTFPEKTRCAVCNSELEEVPRESLKESVPQDIYESKSRLWRCIGCKKVYWEGSHWRNIGNFYEKVKKRI